MEFLSNNFTENHLLKDSVFGQEESLSQSEEVFQEKFFVKGFGHKEFVEKGNLENSGNHLLSKPLEKDLSFENLENLRFSLVENSLVFSSGLRPFESKQDINYLFSSHFF